MVMTEEREQQLLDEIDRLRRFNNRLAEAARGRFVVCEVDTTTAGQIGFHVLAAPDTDDGAIALSLSELFASFIGVDLDGHRENPTPEKE